jgi:hypothetical protein
MIALAILSVILVTACALVALFVLIADANARQ